MTSSSFTCTQLQTPNSIDIVPNVFIKDDHVYANSRDVAAYFGKRHTNVLRDIRDVIRSNLSGSDFNQMFRLHPYMDVRNRQQSSEDMTKAGFMLLVMGYTGKDAMKFKVAYMKRFEEMEAALKAQQQPTFMIPQNFR